MRQAITQFIKRHGRKTTAIAIVIAASAVCMIATTATSEADTPGNPNNVRVTAQTQPKGQTNSWSAANSAKPGDAMRMLIGYQNTSIALQSNVAVRASLAKGVNLTPGTTSITNTTQNAGAPANTDEVATAGITIGNYKAGANAFVTFEFSLPSADKLACGQNDLKNIGIVRLSDGSEYAATAVTKVTRDCPLNAAPTPVAPLQSDGQSTSQNLQPAGQAPASALAPSPKPQPQAPAQPAAPAQPTAPAASNPSPTSPAPTLSSSPSQAPKPTPNALPNSGPVGTIIIFTIATILGTTAHYTYTTRRSQRY